MSHPWVALAGLLLAGCAPRSAGSAERAAAPRAAETVSQPAVSKNATSKEASSMESLKRRVPRVEPVSRGGVRYEVVRGARSRGFNQNGGVIAAVDEKTDRELWTLVVYPISYDPNEEQDVQDIYITSLRVSRDGKELQVEDERKRRFVVNLTDRTVTEKKK